MGAKHCFLTYSRDMVYLSKRAYDEVGKRYVISSESVDHPSVPVDPKVIRSKIKRSGWVLEPLENGQTKATYVINIDVGGKLPRQIVSTVSYRQPMAVHFLRKATNHLKPRVF